VGGRTTETGPPGRRENPPMVRSPLIARIRHHRHPHSAACHRRYGCMGKRGVASPKSSSQPTTFG
jgi:hypothetical protein